MWGNVYISKNMCVKDFFVFVVVVKLSPANNFVLKMFPLNIDELKLFAVNICVLNAYPVSIFC